MNYYFTSEAVTEGHPDKICDKISDKILDIALSADPFSKMAIEATIKNNVIFIYGEATTKAKLNYKKIAREVLKDIGYTEKFKVIEEITNQSQEINSAVCKEKICAGDQGIMFGFACNETEELMPLPITLANKLAKRLTEVRKSDKGKVLKPDGKTQITIEYKNHKPYHIDTIIVSSQHYQNVTLDTLEKYIIKKVINPIMPKKLFDNKTKILINTSGSFIIGGPFGDSGTTGRKIIVDTYGGYSRIGGGCLSSKDPSKVDRSAAYYSRYVAKNIVAHNIADKCEIQVAYAIGKENPISLFIETFDTNKIDIQSIYKYVEENFNFSVDNIIKELDLLKPIYYNLACYGQFGRTDINPSWEQIKETK